MIVGRIVDPVGLVLVISLAGCGSGPATPPAATGRTPSLTANVSARPSPSATPTATQSAPPTAEPSTSEVASLRPAAVAFWDADHGVVGLTIDQPDGSVSGELRITWDGGRTWTSGTVTQDAIAEVAVAGTDDAWVTTACITSPPCETLLYHTADGGRTWTSTWTDLSWVSFVDGSVGWGIPGFGAPTTPGAVRLEHTTDGGRTWMRTPSPCAHMTLGPLRAVSFRTAADGLAVCALTAGAGGELHAVLGTHDGGLHWTTLASTSDMSGGKAVGTIQYGGYIRGIVDASDGTAWMWGDRMAPLGSLDGGRTWSSLGVGDPDVNLVNAAWPLDARRGVALLWAPDRQATLLEATTDGSRTWTERFAWPVTEAASPATPPALGEEWVDVEIPTYVAFAGQPVTMDVTSSPTGGDTNLLLASATIDFGDGTSATRPGSCRARVAFSHRYREAGEYRPKVAAVTSCDPAVGAHLSDALQTVHIFPGAPSASARWPTCTPAGLRLAGFNAGVGLGNVATRITLTNVGRRGCTLEGYPRVVLVRHDGRPSATHDHPATMGAYLFAAVVPARVALRPGEVASFMLGSTDNPFGPDANSPYDVACPPSVAVRVILRGTNEYGTARAPMSVCGGLVDVSPVVPGAAGLRPGY